MVEEGESGALSLAEEEEFEEERTDFTFLFSLFFSSRFS